MKNSVESPFGEWSDVLDEELALRASSGDGRALDQLARRHHKWIYNIALRFTLDPAEASDLAQEALLRICSNIDQYEGRAKFRTWAYRVTFNLFLDEKRRKHVRPWSQKKMDDIPDDTEFAPPVTQRSPETNLAIKELSIDCYFGILLCLDRQQRLVYLLGDILGVSSGTGAALLEISPVTFRKRLERARRDLRNFLSDKCSLIDPSNPCTCAKKTSVFVREGWVDKTKLTFVLDRIRAARVTAQEINQVVDDAIDSEIVTLLQAQPLYPVPKHLEGFAKLIAMFESGTRKERDFRRG